MSESLSKFGVPMSSDRGGILMPAMSHRFRVRIKSSKIAQNDTDDLVMQFNNCIFDFANRLVKFSFRHAITARMRTAKDICAYGLDEIILEGMDGGTETVLYTIQGINVEIIEHLVEHDYTKSQPVIHHFTGRCHTLNIL